MDFLSGIMQKLLTLCYNASAAVGLANYGVAIILLTVLLKVALYPLTAKSFRSMRAMQELSPKIKALQEKYKGNPKKLNEEMARLYKESGVTPMAGCLPMLIQMPFLIAIFFAIRDYQYLQQPDFLWMKNLADPDPSHVLPVLSALTTWISQKQTTTDTSQQSKMMMIFMPLFIGYIGLSFPGGLVLYWVAGNIIQIIQQWWTYRSKPAASQGGA